MVFNQSICSKTFSIKDSYADSRENTGLNHSGFHSNAMSPRRIEDDLQVVGHHKEIAVGKKVTSTQNDGHSTQKSQVSSNKGENTGTLIDSMAGKLF